MTKISVVLNDQILVAAEKVKIASGDIESVFLSVEFDPTWDEFINRTVSFHTSHNSAPTEVLLINNQCTVPAEMLEKAGTMYVGVIGAKADGSAVKTSSITSFKIIQGANHSYTTIKPALNLYLQYLAAMNEKLDPALTNMQKEIDAYKAEIKAELDAEYEALKEKCTKACDLTNVLTTFTSGSWTATEDCWIRLVVTGVSYTGEYGKLSVNGVEIAHYELAAGSSAQQGKATFPPFFVKKGSSVSASSSGATASVTVYGCLY